MKRIIAILLTVALGAALLLTGCGGSGSTTGSAKPIELRFNVTQSESSVWMVCAEEFKRQVEEKTNGRYVISIYPNEQLSSGDQVKGVELLLNGTTDVDMHSTMIIAGIEPKLGAVSMPWLFNGKEDVDRVIFNDGEGGKMIAKLVEDKGCHVIGLCENGFRQLTNSKRPVSSLADMKGLKIRIPSTPQYTRLYQLLGADPITMSWSEVFTALQQGAVDGQENPYTFMKAGKIQEVQSYLTEWNYAYDPIVLSVSSKTWDSLSEEDKAIFEEAGREACAKQVEESRKLEDQIRSEFEAAGMTIVTPTDAQIEEFRAAVAPVYTEFREELTDEVLTALGYQFP